jgi:exonuclease V gamma subunit
LSLQAGDELRAGIDGLGERRRRCASSKRAIADAVQTSLIATLEIPEQDRFQLIQEYEDDHFIHTDAFIELTKALLADLNRRLVETADARSDDVFVSMYELRAANVSFGRGLAQRVP